MCDKCGHVGMTDVKKKSGDTTLMWWVISILVCVFLGIPLCFCVPCCCDSLYNFEHDCAKCGHTICKVKA